MTTSSDPLDLPAHLVDIARDELGETPEIRRAALQELKNRIAALPEVDQLKDTTDLSLVRFLRSRKYDMDRALQSTIDMQRFNSEHPTWTQNLKASEFRIFSSFFQVLQHRGPKGQFIIVLRPPNAIKIFTPEFLKEHPEAMVRCNMFFLDRLSKNVNVQVCGTIVCNTMKGFTASDNFTLTKASKVNHQIGTFKYLSILGIRLSGAFMFDQPFYITWLWPLVRMFLSEKLRSRFHICGSDYDKIMEVIPDTSILPVCIGGTLEDGEFSWIEELVAQEEQGQM